MFKQKMVVTYADGRSAEVTVLPVTHVAFEREYKTSFTEAFSDQTRLRLEHMMWLGWHASRPGVDFESWLETVVGVDPVETDPVDPTSPAPSAGP